MRISRAKILISLLSTLYFLFSFPGISQGALLYSQSANQVIGLDQTFTVDWYLDTQGQNINTIELELNFTPDTLEVLDASAGSSGLDLWVKTPQYDNEKGTIQLIGGTAGGFDTSKFSVFRTTFKAKSLGAAKITMADSSQVLLSDGAGTKMKMSFAQLNFPVVPAEAASRVISSSTHPDQTKWYRDNTVRIKVAPEEGLIYSYSFSSNAEIFPDDQADEVNQEFTFENLPDGIYYFKLNSKNGSSNWEEAGVFRVQIDQTSPDSFTPVVASDPSLFDGKPFLSFATTDKVSGVSKYAVKVGVLGAWIETDSTYYVLPTFALSDEIHVKAVDSAGNEQVSTAKLPGGSINFGKLLLWIIIIGSLLILALLVRKVHKRLAIPKK